MNTLSAKFIFDSVLKEINQFEKDSGEARSICMILLEDKFGISRIDILGEKKFEIDSEILQESILRLKNGEPVQHITGIQWFLDMKLKVNQHVLIPRPETEELVLLAVSELNSLPKPEIVEIGTGSGCISIGIKKRLPNSTIQAFDISPKALEIARENSKLQETDIEFTQADFLSTNFKLSSRIDMLISNPPYIAEKEKAEMEKNVLDYEPHIALFVSDQNPLIFYKKLAETGIKYLKPGGQVLAEINSGLGKETKNVFLKQGYKKVKIIHDVFGKDRIVQAKLN